MTQPSATRMCHRTGFTKKCLSLVSTGKCERWKILTVEENGKVMQKGDCIDDWAFYFGYANERGHAQTTKSLDLLREQVDGQQRQSAQQHQERLAIALIPPREPDKFQHTINLIGNGGDDGSR